MEKLRTRSLALAMSFSLIKQPLKLAFTETMHQLPCFSNNIRLRIGMMYPLYMYLPAAYEHLRSQERKQKIGEVEVMESRVADDPPKKELRTMGVSNSYKAFHWAWSGAMTSI